MSLTPRCGDVNSTKPCRGSNAVGRWRRPYMEEAESNHPANVHTSTIHTWLL